MSLRCVIVDDSRSFLDAALGLLALEGIDVVGTASDTADAVRQVAQLRPDVVLVDVMLGRESGLDLAQRLAGSGAAIVMISTHSVSDLEEILLDSPARGFLSKAELSGPALRRVLGTG